MISIYSESILKQHPQLKQIPFFIWSEYFGFRVNDDYVQLMACPYDEVISMLPDTKIDTKLVFCLILAHSQNLDIAMANLLIEKADNKNDVLSAMAFTGRLDLLQHIFDTLLEDEKKSLLTKDSCVIFKLAAANGHKNVLEYLASLVSDDIAHEMVKAWGYKAFLLAAENGHKEVLEYLVSLVSDDIVPKMVKGMNYHAFSYAAKNGHKDVLEYLVSLVSDDIAHEMVKARGYEAFRYAARNGHIDTLKYLVSLVSDDIAHEMVTLKEYQALGFAAAYGHKHAVNYLLGFSQCLSYAEMHEREYGVQYVHPFIEMRLQQLQQAQSDYYEENPAGVFDIADDEQCRQGFYMLRNLIRRNDDALMDNINFLLNIPGIKALAHTEVTKGMSNELLRLALTQENHQAAERLLIIPAVRELAVQNNYYADEMRGNLDLRALAQNAESSMTALTPGEKKRLEKLRHHYQADISDLGQENLFAALKVTLEEDYRDAPAMITIDGKKQILPLQWHDFQAMNLTQAQKKDALKAYYQNNPHTALRYLSKPNHWMAPNAGYVYINDDRTERWATFEEYKPLIVLMFRAAFDEDDNMRPVQEGNDLKARKAHFINELALIGRAHNWDKARHATDVKTGELLYDENGNPIMEEYDDLKGDKPSCFSGVKRRLFQSLIDHPLFSIIAKDTLEGELRIFLRRHFDNHINQDNINLINEAMEAVIDGETLSEQQQEELSRLNVSEDYQNDFINDIEDKYKESFSQDPSLKFWLKEQFVLRPGITCHVFQFYALTSFKELIEKKNQDIGTDKSKDKGKAPDTSSELVQQGFFATQPGVNDEAEPGCSTQP